MAQLTEVVKVTKQQYERLVNGETIGGHTYNADTLYLVEDSGIPEIDLTGYATEEWVTAEIEEAISNIDVGGGGSGNVEGSDLTKSRIIVGDGGNKIKASGAELVGTFSISYYSVPTTKAISDWVSSNYVSTDDITDIQNNIMYFQDRLYLGRKDDDICSIFIGHDASCNVVEGEGMATAIGYEAYAEEFSVCIGSQAQSTDYNTIAIGASSSNNGAGSVVLGNSSFNNTTDSLLLGNGNQALTGDGLIIVGNNNNIPDASSRGIIIGNDIWNGVWTSPKILIGNNFFNKYFDGTNWVTGSDIRDKIEINPLQNSLNIIKSIEPISFKYNRRRSYSKNNSLMDYDTEAYDNKTLAEKNFSLGFSAQSVAKAIEEYYGDECYGGVITHDHEDTEDAYYMTNEGLIPFLVGAIQEQQKQIDKLLIELEELRK